MDTPNPDISIDITDTVDRKFAALRAHASQAADHDALEAMMRRHLAGNASSAGLPEGRFAELFTIVRTS
jgi:LmbE family N-acetylglucosaminyl deacetylase